MKKAVSLIVICLLTVSINQCVANLEPASDPSLCYGFILPNIKLENKTLENQIFCRIRHLVNDLLREEISVYWTTLNLTINVGKVDSGKVEEELFFEKGSFIVPFTGDDIIDSKIIVIICDYNQSNEIEENRNIRIPVYLIKEQINIRGHDLLNVKIANYINFLTCGEGWFANIASKCGFLNFEFLNHKDTHRKLTNSAYNLLIWPAYDGFYDWPYPLFEYVLDLTSGRTNAIRKFVRNGGGFVGSCYAVFMASCGATRVPVNFSKLAHNPYLPSIGFLAISDIISGDGKTIIPGLEQQIMDTDHPVSFGVDNYLIGGYYTTGPMVVEVGKGIDVIANFKNDSKLNNTPSIVSNKFGDGKVVLFAPHPELRDPDTSPGRDLGTEGTYNGKKLVSNAFYYATSPEETEQEVSESRPLSFITDVWDVTINLNDFLNEQKEVFEDIEIGINESVDDIADLTNRIYSILEIIQQIRIEQNIDQTEFKNFLYYGGTKYLIYCFDLIKEYLENTSITIQTIEKIYSLLEDDTDFIEQLEQLKNELSSKINEIKEILSKSSLKLQKMENILESYGQHQILRKLREKIFKKTSHDIEIQTKLAFQQMPGGYFNTLKFLRHHWYNYEASRVL